MLAVAMCRIAREEPTSHRGAVKQPLKRLVQEKRRLRSEEARRDNFPRPPRGPLVRAIVTAPEAAYSASIHESIRVTQRTSCNP